MSQTGIKNNPIIGIIGSGMSYSVREIMKQVKISSIDGIIVGESRDIDYSKSLIKPKIKFQ